MFSFCYCQAFQKSLYKSSWQLKHKKDFHSMCCLLLRASRGVYPETPKWNSTTNVRERKQLFSAHSPTSNASYRQAEAIPPSTHSHTRAHTHTHTHTYIYIHTHRHIVYAQTEEAENCVHIHTPQLNHIEEMNILSNQPWTKDPMNLQKPSFILRMYDTEDPWFTAMCQPGHGPLIHPRFSPWQN